MDLEKKAIERIKLGAELSLHNYKKPIIVTYSGGKDSDVLLELFKRSGVPFEVQHSHTTVDAPPTVYHVREVFKKLEEAGIKCKIEYPKLTMWQLIIKKKMPPTRIARYCCSYLKEAACKGRMISTGVRWGESNARRQREEFEILTSRKEDRIAVKLLPNEKEYEQLAFFYPELILQNDNTEKRKFIERCELKAKSVCNPILEWTDADIWDYITSEKIKMNPLYKMGFNRVGCIGCPMASKARYKEFEMFPTYKEAYIKAFDKMLENMNGERWKNGEEVFKWWMEERNMDGQLDLFKDIGIEEPD